MAQLKLRNIQKQELGNALTNELFGPRDFELEKSPESNASRDAIRITHKDTGETFDIVLIHPDDGKDPFFNVERPLIGSHTTSSRHFAATWSDVLQYIEEWAQSLTLEVTAEDPWSQAEAEAFEDMNTDDEGFSVDELPRVDKAIDAALVELATAAIDKGNDVAEIRKSVKQIEDTLKSTARSASKREWMTVFKTLITTELAKWGLEHDLLGKITHTLVAAAQDIAQLAEHASKLQL